MSATDIEKQLDSIIAKLVQATKETASYAEQVTKGYAPVKTGNLQSNIKAEVTSDYSFNLVSEAEYSAFVNYGTVHQQPNPFFDRGTADTYNKWIENLKNAMKK